MLKRNIEPVNIENASIGFRNFSGKEGKFNTEGNRNFVVFLTEEMAHRLSKDGWNVKWLKPREESEPEQAILSVKVAYNHRPPKIMLVSGNTRTPIGEEQIHILDYSDIDYVDIQIVPFKWEYGGKRGVKAYLKLMYVVLVKDVFESKYVNQPDDALQCVLGDDGKCIE